VLATIPRSGNGWIRGMLEASTRVATASVYPEQGASFVTATDAFSAPCGWLNDCALVRSATVNPVVIKVTLTRRTLTAVSNVGFPMVLLSLSILLLPLVADSSTVSHCRGELPSCRRSFYLTVAQIVTVEGIEQARSEHSRPHTHTQQLA
jgi:hypothetical protein